MSRVRKQIGKPLDYIAPTTVRVVWDERAQCFDIRRKKVSKEIEAMRAKLYSLIGVKWQWHVVLSFSESDLEFTKEYFEGMGGAVLTDFLKKLRYHFPKKVKYFWKYEEGRETERPHFHMLLEIKTVINTAKIARKLFPEAFPERIDIKKVIKDLRWYWINRDKSDLEILFGLWLHQLWEKGIVYAREIKSERDLVFYVEKDIAKETGLAYKKASANMYRFGKGYKYRDIPKKEPDIREMEVASLKKARWYLYSTSTNFMKVYGRDTYYKRYRDLMTDKLLMRYR